MSGGRILAYGMLGLPLAFAAVPIYVHLPRYYAGVGGLELGTLGSLLLVSRLLDAVIDPLLGTLADHVCRRRMLTWSLPPFAVGFWALFNPAPDYPGLWLLGALILTYTGFSAASIAYQAWGAELGGDSGIRTRLVAARELLGLIGVLLAAVLPTMLADTVDAGIARLAWVLPLLLAVAAITLFAVHPSGWLRDSAALSRPPWRHLGTAMGAVVGEPAFRRLLAVFVANGLAAALPATLFLFFVTDVLQAESDSGLMLALYFVAGIVSLPLWVRLGVRHGRVRAWFASMLLAMVAFAGAGLIGSGDHLAYAAVCLTSGLALGADLVLPAAIAADLGERMQRAGACFGLWNFAAKLNLALAAGLALPMLGWLGYVPGSGDGLAALSCTYALLPLAFKALAAMALWRWRDRLEIRS